MISKAGLHVAVPVLPLMVIDSSSYRRFAAHTKAALF